jgi:hypothetical protein
MKQEFIYKGFEIIVTRHTQWVRGVTTAWDRPKKRSKFEAYNPATAQFFSGWGTKTKAKEFIDSLEKEPTA